MNVPIVGLVSALLSALGIGGLGWYQSMSPAQRREADRLAMEHARKLFRKGLEQLSSHELSRVFGIVKGYFGG